MEENYTVKYFQDRIPEDKDYYMTLQWLEYVKPETILCFGDGIGKHTHVCRSFNYNAVGYDPYSINIATPVGLSKEHLFSSIPDGVFDLILCIDVLEHCESEEEAEKEIKTIADHCKTNGFTILSICDLSLWDIYKDPTHKLCRSRRWWEWKIKQAGFELLPVPETWLFYKQLYLAKRVL